MTALTPRTLSALTDHESTILAAWSENLLESGAGRDVRIEPLQLQRQTKEFLALVVIAANGAERVDISKPEWADARRFLEELSRSRALQGFDSQHTASFIFP